MVIDEAAAAAAVGRLRRAGCVAAEQESAELVAAAPDATTLEAWLTRREQGEPPAWITGRVRFCGRWLAVTPGVYVPRAQTEHLARRAGAHLPGGGRALDLCTGAGAVAAHLSGAAPGAQVLGVDLDPRAAACARVNGVVALVSDLDESLAVRARFDLVTAVAPYVPTGSLGLLPADVQRYEPPLALDGGPDGLALVRRVIAVAGRRLRPGGWLVIEVGGQQDEALSGPLEVNGFATTRRWRDDEGDLRGIEARMG
jgi:release factor glutamine methyltransferase